MSYNWITSSSSPNYTPGSRAQATWGRPRTIEAISIHWWGDPNTNPSFEGVVSWLCNPKSGASAHLVATGTGRKVACLVNFGDASWATNSANPYTISIELDPRCRNEDYDVAAEVIAQLRQVYGNIPLVPHRQFIVTQCPGNYDLGRLDREAAQKVAKPEWDWGHVENKQVEPPKPVNKPVPAAYSLAEPITVIANLDRVELWDLDTNPSYASKKTFTKGSEIEVVAAIDFNGTQYYQTEYSFNRNKHGINRADVRIKEKPPVVEPPKPVEPPVVVPVEPPTTSPEAPGDGFTENDRTMLQDIWKAVQSLLEAFKRIFNIGEKK